MTTYTELAVELDAIYRGIADAFARKDLDAISRHIAREWRGVGTDGVPKGKDELMANLKQMFEGAESLSWPRHISSVLRAGSKVVARVGGLLTIHKKGGESTSTNLVNEDTWEMRDGVWINIASRAVES